MHPKRARRLLFVLIILISTTIATTLVLYALQQNINLYYTPAQIIKGEETKSEIIRIGGMVKKDSVHFERGLDVRFILTDNVNNILIEYNGVLPDLFRDGQGIVVQGRFNNQDIFMADQVLAKHGAEYMPPGIKLTATQKSSPQKTPQFAMTSAKDRKVFS